MSDTAYTTATVNCPIDSVMKRGDVIRVADKAYRIEMVLSESYGGTSALTAVRRRLWLTEVAVPPMPPSPRILNIKD
jgi:hypothetical protein